MLNLIKYEIRKTMSMKAIALVITAIFEVFFLIAVYRGSEEKQAIAFSVFVFAGSIAIIVMGLYSIRLLSKDLNTKQSYMLFMTPNSSYKILGAKYIENGLSIVMTTAFYVILGFINITLLMTQYTDLADTLSFFRDYIGKEFAYIDTEYVVTSIFAGTAKWFFIVATAYLAVTICASILNGRKFNGLISFVIFLVIVIAINKILNALFLSSFVFTSTYNYMMIAIHLVLAFIMYIITAWIMDNVLSV